MQASALRDLVYFDVARAASLWSQLEGGLREKVQVQEDSSDESKFGARAGLFKVLEAELGNTSGERLSILESKVLHHDLLNRLASDMERLGLVTDLREAVPSSESSADTINSLVRERPYLLAEGRASFEDYRRLAEIADEFNHFTEFIKKCSRQAVQQSAEFAEIKQSLEEAKQALKSEKDRNKKAVAKGQLQQLENRIDAMLQTDLAGLDQWFVDGLKRFISVFIPNRINLRIFPCHGCPEFQVIANLKRDCFVDEALEHLLYGYGNRPNVPLSVFGLITSIPAKSNKSDPPDAPSADGAADDKDAMEEAFRNIFRAFDDLESHVRFSRYPNVTVHPIAVFREIPLDHGENAA